VSKDIIRVNGKTIGDKWLQSQFGYLNWKFFNNRIPIRIEVKFVDNCGHKVGKKFKRVDGFFDQANDSISIDSGLRNFPDFAMITLAHEMAHAHLRFQGYTGWTMDAGHGTRFQIEIGRLWNEGFYDGIL